MTKIDKKDIGRRNFIKIFGAIASSTLLFGQESQNKKLSNTQVKELQNKKREITFRINPNTKEKVSLLGYGCMRWPLRPTPDKKGEEIDQETVNELVDYAIEHGVNYFDTSPRYVRGLSEKATGIALSRHSRDKYFIATKMSNFPQGSKYMSREESIAMYHNSFKDLKVDYIDYYLLHVVGMGGMEPFQKRFIDNKILDFLLEEREKGRIRNLGWSYHGDVSVFDHALTMGVKWDFVQIQLNYIDWENASGWNTNAKYLYNELVKRDIPVIVMEPLLGGRLARLNHYAVKILKEMQPQKSCASWAFRYAGSFKNVLTVLSGMVYMEHLKENVETYSPLKKLNEKEYKALERVTKIMVDSDYVPCTECQYCMPCPYGIDIPKVFAHYNKCVSEGTILKSANDKNYIKNRREFLIGYDRTVPKLRQASHCIGCKVCEKKCPQRINISKEMVKIDEYTELLKRGVEF